MTALFAPADTLAARRRTLARKLAALPPEAQRAELVAACVDEGDSIRWAKDGTPGAINLMGVAIEAETDAEAIDNWIAAARRTRPQPPTSAQAGPC